MRRPSSSVHLDPVGKGRATLDAKDPAQHLVAEGPQRQEHPRVEQVELALEPGAACVALVHGGLVGRRRASHRRRDPGIREPQPVAAPDAVRLVGEPGAVKRCVQEVAAPIAGEHPPGPVGTVRRWREPDHHQPGRRVPEAGHGPAPVLLVPVGRPALAGHLLAPGDQAGALPTAHDLVLEVGERRRTAGSHGVEDTFSRTMARAAAPPSSTLVLLVRHGQTPTTGKVLPGRAAGLHLAGKGIDQAEAVAARIAALQDGKRGVAAVYASPLERTLETAAPIAKALGLRVRRAKGLLECEFGQWTGAELSKLSKLPEWRTVQRNPSGFRFPGGESFTEMQTRIGTAIEMLRAKHAGETVVAVSHADPIKAAVAQAMGMHLDLFQRIVISPCSVSAVLYGSDGPIVLAVNSTGDLRALAPS